MLMDAIRVGPLVIKYLWIVLLFSAICSYLFMKLRIKRYPTLINVNFLSTVFNGLFYGILIYKFSIVLIRPSLLFENPKAIIYFTGGTTGFILALIVGFVYIAFQVWKQKINLKETANVLGTGIFVALVTYYLQIFLLF